MAYAEDTKDGVILNIRVLPRSSKSGFAEIQENALKIKIAAPPVDGKANDECVKVIAERLGVKKACVKIVAGHKSKNKRVSVSGIKKKDVEFIVNESS
jgi:hypothetical protein